MRFDWDTKKNTWLRENRYISFEEIISLIEGGALRAVLTHPKRPNQKIFIVEREGYAYNVPFVEQENGTCFLKTAYPSHNSTKMYIGV
jgi:hypothetical protein